MEEAAVRQKKALEAMGERMLKGWKLLGTVCPMEGCNTTLMESPSGEEVFCHSCCAPVVAAAPFGRVNKNNVSKKRDDASKMIGDRLLSGWTLLDRDCPKRGCVGVPLVRSPSTNVEECVSCGPAAAEAPPVPKSDSVSLRGSTAAETPRAGEDQSVALSKHLLMGWAMLAELCPKCASPLMRSKDDTVTCVQPTCVQRRDLEEKRQKVEGEDDGRWSRALEAVSRKIASLAASLETANSSNVTSISQAIASLALATKPLRALSEEDDAFTVAALDAARLALAKRANVEASSEAANTSSDEITSSAFRIRAIAEAALTLKTCDE